MDFKSEGGLVKWKKNKSSMNSSAMFSYWLYVVSVIFFDLIRFGFGANILMITMGGTKSHKVPFIALAKGLIPRGHHITFLNGFVSDAHIDGLVEVTPIRFVNYIENYTNWDLVGARYAGRTPVSIWQAIRYPTEACNSLLGDVATVELLTQKFHLAIVDGAFPECALGIVYRLGTPYVFINTVGFYTGSLAIAGNPIVYAVTPHVFTGLTQSMDFWQRVQNLVMHTLAEWVHQYYTMNVHSILMNHLDPDIPHPYTLARNVSFVLQNGHPALTYARPFHPNVAEIACIHCRPPVALPYELESFMNAAPAGVIFFSMGSSVRAANMPEELRRLLIAVFARLPQYHVLWKWEGGGNATYSPDIPGNVRLSAWLPQQDILGHRKLKAFITHGGLLSMYEAIYHVAPMVMLPVFCDHDVNAAKAAADGYAVRMPLESLTVNRLYGAVHDIIVHNVMYRRALRRQRALLLDQLETPLNTAIFWTEYVLRNNGAESLKAKAKDLNFFVYYSLDVLLFGVCCACLIIIFLRKLKILLFNNLNLDKLTRH